MAEAICKDLIKTLSASDAFKHIENPEKILNESFELARTHLGRIPSEDNIVKAAYHLSLNDYFIGDGVRYTEEDLTINSFQEMGEFEDGDEAAKVYHSMKPQ